MKLEASKSLGKNEGGRRPVQSPRKGMDACSVNVVRTAGAQVAKHAWEHVNRAAVKLSSQLGGASLQVQLLASLSSISISFLSLALPPLLLSFLFPPPSI